MRRPHGRHASVTIPFASAASPSSMAAVSARNTGVTLVRAADDSRANLGGGGGAGATDLSAREREICATIGPELKRRGLLFTGIDVIDGHLTEINVTSPTGLRAIRRLGGPDLSEAIWDAIEGKVGRG